MPVFITSRALLACRHLYHVTNAPSPLNFLPSETLSLNPTPPLPSTTLAFPGPTGTTHADRGRESARAGLVDNSGGRMEREGAGEGEGGGRRKKKG